jgi:hypothetical protein
MKKLGFLPRKFKLAGLCFIVLSFLSIVIFHLFDLFPGQQNWKLDISKTLLIIGLFLIAITREKVEDEFVENSRLKSMFFAFVFSIVIFLGDALIPIFKMQAFSYSGFEVFFEELALYLIFFHLTIRGGMNKNAQ